MLMELRLRKKGELYDIWKEEDSRKRPGKLHPSAKRNKKNPLPHPGQSYNPDPEEHKKLLQKVLRKELAYQRKEASLRKAVDVKVSQKELSNAEKKELESGIEHLIKKDSTKRIKQKADDADSDGSSTEDAYSDYNEEDFQAIVKDKRVQEKRKSRQQRLRQLKDRLQRKAAKVRKSKNIRLSKFDSIKRMIKELDARDKEAAAEKKSHKKIKNERLGQKFEQSDPIYCLSSELPKNLLQTSCSMGAIVREQLESFQSRLMVEPTQFQVRKRKYKKKEFDRKVAAEQEG